jgi:hypothetical protein
VFPSLYTSMRDKRRFGQVLVVAFVSAVFLYGSMAVVGCAAGPHASCTARSPPDCIVWFRAVHSFQVALLRGCDMFSSCCPCHRHSSNAEGANHAVSQPLFTSLTCSPSLSSEECSVSSDARLGIRSADFNSRSQSMCILNTLGMQDTSRSDET